ncbi:MAG: sulfatase [Myxococcota bacterium]
MHLPRSVLPLLGAPLLGAPLLVALALTAAVPGCSAVGCRSEGRPQPVSADRAEAIALRTLPFAELTVPADSRPGHAEPPPEVPLEGPWRYVGATRKGMHKYATDIPIRPRGLFFNKPQAGMSLRTADGEEVRYDRFGHSNTAMWAHDRHDLIVYLPERTGPPDPGAYVLRYPRAVQRERALNRAFSGAESDATFAWTEVQDDWDHWRGLLLPAPGVAAWDVDVPPGGELTFVSGLVEPELRVGAASDGAGFTVEVEVGGRVTEVLTDTVAVRAFEEQRVDLSRWAGQSVRLRLRTDPGPGGNADYDYVFFAEPAVASRQADPVRVVMVFIDTLRPDHMSLYGYERDTTATIDHLAGEAAVFDNARSVAPWTLPSARTIVTGRHPEYYDVSPTLQSILGDRGWATAFIAGNVYLSVNFGMTRDWDFHRVGLWPLAEEATDDALHWLDAHDGRNALLQVHYMGTHLPYVEPPSYRHRYAGDPVGGLRDEFHLSDVKRANVDRKPAAQQFVKDRYDNNVRYVTDQVQRILDALDDNDILLLYADHGEEFWDHGGYEHGHSLFNELVHVPLVIRAPGVRAERIEEPVQLIDLAPTVLDLVGAPIPEGTQGRSLVPLLRGDPDAEAAFADRPIAFGRPLYGMERWGVLRGHDKWMTSEGREAWYDLSKDPKELSNLLIKDPWDSGARFRDDLSNALGREVVVGYRLTPTQFKSAADWGTWVLCSVPGGFAETWAGDDPLMNSFATVRPIDDPQEIERLLAERQVVDPTVDPAAGGVEICWPGDYKGSREVYLVPKDPLLDVGHDMQCSGYLGDAKGGKRGTMRIPPVRYPALGVNRVPFNKLVWDQRQVLWQMGISPVPAGAATVARDSEAEGMLSALGYVDPDRDRPLGAAAGCEPPAVDLSPWVDPEAPTADAPEVPEAPEAPAPEAEPAP